MQINTKYLIRNVIFQYRIDSAFMSTEIFAVTVIYFEKGIVYL